MKERAVNRVGIQTEESGVKDKQSFCTKETVPPNPDSLEKTGARAQV